MKRAYQGIGIIRGLKEDPAILCLGADFTAEHEWGIGGIQDTLGIDPHDKRPGIARRSQTRRLSADEFLLLDPLKMPESGARKKKDCTLFAVADSISPRATTPEAIKKHGIFNFHHAPHKAGEPSTSWSQQGFAVLAGEDKHRVFLREIAAAAQNLDLAVWIYGSSNPFGRGGLAVSIRSRLLPEHLEKMTAADKAQDELHAADRKTGIRQRLAAASEAGGDDKAWPRLSWCKPFTFHALSPRMIEEDLRPFVDTAHPVVFFLNPALQNENNSGWFTVEELDAWIQGKGPIPKKNGVESALTIASRARKQQAEKSAAATP